MSYRLDRSVSEMRTLLGKQLADRFDNDALAYANTFGIAAQPRRGTPAQIARLAEMRKKRQTNILAGLTLDEVPASQAMSIVIDNVNSGFDALRADVKEAFQARINKDDGKFYYEKANGKVSSNWSELRKAYRGKPEYYSPAWALVINYNKTAAASARLKNIIKKGWTNQNLMDRAARSTWRNLLKNARDGTDYAAKGSAAMAKMLTRYEAKAATVASIRQILGGGGGGGANLPPNDAINEEIIEAAMPGAVRSGGQAWLSRAQRQLANQPR